MDCNCYIGICEKCGCYVSIKKYDDRHFTFYCVNKECENNSPIESGNLPSWILSFDEDNKNDI